MKLSESLHYLGCPQCKRSLIEESNALLCKNCKLYYPIVDDIPYLLLEHAYSDKGDAQVTGEQGRYWDANKKASKYLVTQSPMRKYMDIVEIEEPLHWLNPSSDELILDLGCGSGRQLCAISEKAPVIGVDRSVGMLQRTKDQLTNDNAFLVLGDATNVPIQDNAITKISSVRVIQHFNDQDKQKTIAECYRMLKDGGYVQLINYNKITPHYWFIAISSSVFRYPLNFILFFPTFLLSMIVKIWKVKIDTFSPIFAWKHPEIAKFSTMSGLSKKLRKANFNDIDTRKFQVGDVFISTILARVWSKASEGTISETFSILLFLFPEGTKRRYERNLAMDRQARTKKSLGWRLRFKDKVIAMAKKDAQDVEG